MGQKRQSSGNATLTALPQRRRRKLNGGGLKSQAALFILKN